MLVATERSPEAADTALVRAAALGDRAAFGVLYEQYRRMVHGILLSYVAFGDAEDLMQDVFVAAMQRLSTLRDAPAFGGWLASIARHTAVDHVRRRMRIVEANERNCGAQPPERIGDEAERVFRGIQALPEAYRETMMLRLVEGMNGPEIAARTGLKPDSVRVNLCRGLKLLRESLGRNV